MPSEIPSRTFRVSLSSLPPSLPSPAPPPPQARVLYFGKSCLQLGSSDANLFFARRPVCAANTVVSDLVEWGRLVSFL